MKRAAIDATRSKRTDEQQCAMVRAMLAEHRADPGPAKRELATIANRLMHGTADPVEADARVRQIEADPTTARDSFAF